MAGIMSMRNTAKSSLSMRNTADLSLGVEGVHFLLGGGHHVVVGVLELPPPAHREKGLDNGAHDEDDADNETVRVLEALHRLPRHEPHAA